MPVKYRWRHIIATTTVLAAAAMAPATSVRAQRESRTFTLQIENDAVANSDTGYTNGLRLSWTLVRYRRGMSLFTTYGFPTVLRVLRLQRAGVIPDKYQSAACDSTRRRARKAGACFMLNLGLGQTMFTPDSLATTLLQSRDQPYAGFLFVNIGVTTIDSPRERGHRAIVFTQFSNQLVLGVTGGASLAEDTQSLAHWTWSTGSHRPLGWGNQLRQSLQIGLLTDLLFRPPWLEKCGNRCDGTLNEDRWWDATPHVELVAGTTMVRATGGATVRVGRGFPDAFGAQRIPITIVQETEKRQRSGACIICEPFWGYAFVNGDARYVPYNMFLHGGLADGGPRGWRERREIDPRHHVFERAVGGAFGNSRMMMSGQYVWRTPEYDVRGFNKEDRTHKYVSLGLSINTR